MIRRRPRSTRTSTLFPCTTLVRSMAAVVAIGAAIVPVSGVVATAIPLVVAAAVVAAMATVVVAGRCRGGHRHRRQGEQQGSEFQGGLPRKPPRLFACRDHGPRRLRRFLPRARWGHRVLRQVV